MYVFHLAEVFSVHFYTVVGFLSLLVSDSITEQAMEGVLSMSLWDQQKSAKLGSSQAKNMLYCGKS